MEDLDVDELDRKRNITIWSICIVITLIVSIVFFFIYFKKNEVHYVHCEEEGSLDYKVALKENDYFVNNMLGKDNQYIASLINYINADFKYKLKIEEGLDYNYKYKVVADVNVIDDDTNKTIYSYSEDILDEVIGQSSGILDIDENVKIDYGKYNKKINEFVNIYNLSNVTSKLTLRMNIGIEGKTEKLNNKDSVISMDIPLTTNTIAIDVNTDLLNNNGEQIALMPTAKNTKVWRNTGIVFLVTDLILLGFFVKYVKDTETEKDKYNGEMKRILNNYGSYISKVEDEFDMKGYQILKVTNFIDLLEIRDTIQVPIIMIENKEQFVTCFIIPTNNNILYFYSLGITQYVLPRGKENEEKASEKNV